MAKLIPLKNLQQLDDKLWDCSFYGKRLSAIYPLYVERYRGPRISKSRNYHDFWELICVTSGKGAMLETKETPAEENSIFLVPPGVLHDEYSEGILDTIWIGLDGEGLEKLNKKSVMSLSSESLTNKIIELWRFAARRNGAIGPELEGMTLAIIGQFTRLLQEGSETELLKIDQAIRFLQEHFTEDISIPELAAKLNYSEGHFYRKFKRHTGMTPINYLIFIRIKNAMQLLKRTELKIGDIAPVSGFRDQFYFSRAFRKITGSSPSHFRKQ
jgi:AraC-like DNA-binding protein